STPTTSSYPLSLHDALPISRRGAMHCASTGLLKNPTIPPNHPPANLQLLIVLKFHAFHLVPQPHSFLLLFLRLRHLMNLRLPNRSEEHTSELQSRENLVCRL